MIRSVVLSLAILTAATSQAGVITFSDRASWEAAVVGSPTVVDFNTYATDVSTNGIDFGPFTIANGLLDAPPVTSHDIDGSTYVNITHGGAKSITYHSPISGWGADLDHAQGSWLRVLLSSPEDLELPYTGGDNPAFFGFITWPMESFTTIQFLENGLDKVGYDNISSGTEVVPEPSSLVVLGLGLAGLAVRRRRKRTSK